MLLICRRSLSLLDELLSVLDGALPVDPVAFVGVFRQPFGVVDGEVPRHQPRIPIGDEACM